MLTAKLLGATRVALINLLGRDPTITMLAAADLGAGYMLVHGVYADQPIARYLPFTYRLGHGEPVSWDDEGDIDPGVAAINAATVASEIVNGNRDDPHA